MILSSTPKYYWDACIWIELITQSNPDRLDRCKYVIEQAENNAVELWTSTFTLAEVWKRICEGERASIAEEKDKAFEDYIEKEFIRKVQVDVDVGKLARRLLRKFPGLGKPQDAVHVASCLLNNVDEMHTFDNSDLIKFDGKFPRRDQIKLKICPPPARPDDGQPELFNNQK